MNANIKTVSEAKALRRKLQTQRAVSFKFYLDDCNAGVWSVKAWNDHKARMAKAEKEVAA